MQLSQSLIGEWLAESRKRAGLSQRKAAEHLDTDAGTISRWENGKQPMSAEAFLELVQLYRSTKELVLLLAQWERAPKPAAAATRRGA